MKNKKMTVEGSEIAVLASNEQDYISLTDMVKEIENGLVLIEKWLRNKNTIEFLGIWEEIYNPKFNSPEFEGIENPNQKGNIRDYANVSQLVCLVNLENLNALFIKDSINQQDRLRKLNQTAIQQMQLLLQDNSIKKLN